MNTWTPDLGDSSGPLYLAIADALARDLEAGQLQPGERLPTQRQLARSLGVNAMTVSRAYKEAARRGLVEGEVGRGTFIRQPEPVGVDLDPSAGDSAELIDFHFNLPASDPDGLAVPTVLSGLGETAGRELLHAGYSTTGLWEHRVAGAEWLRTFGVLAEAERTVVCGGAQHAMTLAFSSLTRPGDLVLTEALTYPGMRALAEVLGLRLLGLERDREGLLPEAFEAACKRGGSKALYLMPTVQNPTASILPADRRQRIAEIARQYRVAVVEDDSYGYLCPDPPPPIAHFAPERTYFLTTTSKQLAAGLRVGYLLAPTSPGAPGLAAQRLGANAGAIGWLAAPLMAEVASRLTRDGSARHMVEWKRREARARRRLYDQQIPSSAGVTHSYPGSSHVWLTLNLPWRSADLIAQARQRGVALTPAEAFVVGRAPAPEAVRLCLGTPQSRQAVERGLAILADILAAGPSAYRSIV